MVPASFSIQTFLLYHSSHKAKAHRSPCQALTTCTRSTATEATNQLLETSAKVNLRPPTEEYNENTTRAHSLAREATVENSEVNSPPWAQVHLRASALRWARANAKPHRKDKFQRSTTGQFTRQLDSALSGPHTKMLYDSLDREKASILAQLRTGHARLNGHLHRIGKTDSDLCECSIERETVVMRCNRPI